MGFDVKLDNSNLFTAMYNAAYSAGQYSVQVEQLEAVVCKSDQKLSSFLFTKTINTLNRWFKHIGELKSSSVQQLPAYHSSALFSQAQAVQNELTALGDKLHHILHQMFKRAFELCRPKVFERDCLNRFRNAPTLDHLKEAEVEQERSKLDFLHVVRLKKIAKEYKIKLFDDESKDALELYKRIEIFEKLLDKKDPLNMVSLLNRLAIISYDPSAHSVEDRAQLQSDFNRCLQRFSQKFQEELDRNVYLLSPESKEGEEWKKPRRYDSLPIFKQALAKTFQDHLEALWKKKQPKNSSVHIDSLYALLHGIALGPESKDPVTWAKNELPSLFPLIETISLRDLEKVEKYRSK